jgi:hypothetical protein
MSTGKAFTGVLRPGLEADHPLPSHAEVFTACCAGTNYFTHIRTIYIVLVRHVGVPEWLIGILMG